MSLFKLELKLMPDQMLDLFFNNNSVHILKIIVILNGSYLTQRQSTLNGLKNHLQLIHMFNLILNLIQNHKLELNLVLIYIRNSTVKKRRLNVFLTVILNGSCQILKQSQLNGLKNHHQPMYTFNLLLLLMTKNSLSNKLD